MLITDEILLATTHRRLHILDQDGTTQRLLTWVKNLGDKVSFNDERFLNGRQNLSDGAFFCRGLFRLDELKISMRN
jgi:hypothetical protein